MARNERRIDRLMADSVGGYPVNYGFVPQTLSYDGDPLDVLVLGPALPGGSIIRGEIVGLMKMDDEKGRDMKVVIARVDEHGRRLDELTTAEQARIGAWFDGYERPEAAQGKWSKVSGWGSAAEARRAVTGTHGFFRRGLADGGAP